MEAVIGNVDGNWVKIYERAVKVADDPLPEYKSEVYIEIKPVNRTNNKDVYDQPIKEANKEKYRELYDKFLAQEKVTLDGLPIEQWTAIDRAEAASIIARGYLTVQQLAAQDPSGPLTTFIKKAKETLSADSRVNELEKKLNEQAALIEELKANQKKKPGRPKST